MSAVVRGWCPGAHRPMASGDGLILRLRPRGGRLSAREAAGIAALAARHGNGVIDLSARAGLQIRGVAPEGHAPLLAGLAALGLIDADAGAEARRNVTLTPFWRKGDGSLELALALEDALAADRSLALPVKFGFAVDTGPRRVLGQTAADIRLERAAAGGLLLRADGAATGRALRPETAVAAAGALARWFLASGGEKRMAAHLAAGVPLPPELAGDAAPAPADPAPAPGPVAGTGWLVAPEFGRLDASLLADLARLGHGLRLTPWRMLLVEGIGIAPRLTGLVEAADDPRLRIHVCPGAPDCAQAEAETRGLARALAAGLPAALPLVHVSGCAKGCAHPGPAPVTLAGRAGRFDLVRGGRASDPPDRTGLRPGDLAARPDILTEPD
ncbi:precorrin-3B synthase [Rhodobacteraceae bacterium DSL-40]|uniref:precorrin-3B synthase n=1 Tax=Amaricoccus sp. B4 TaxID=3368557 RepID=UPI000DAE071D